MTIPFVPPDREPGYRLSADNDINVILDLLRRQQHVPNAFSDVTGTYVRPQRTSTSSGVQIIRFFIVSVDPYCNTCTALGYILSRPTWGQAVYGERTETFDWNGSTLEGSCVDVYDFAGCYLNEPEDDLVGRIGYASLLTGYQPTWCGIEEYQDEGAYTPKWEIISPLCCKDTNCGVVI